MPLGLGIHGLPPGPLGYSAGAEICPSMRFAADAHGRKWHISDLAPCPLYGRHGGQSGHGQATALETHHIAGMPAVCAAA
jgi:hypothetical protein